MSEKSNQEMTIALDYIEDDQQIPLFKTPVYQGSHCPMHVVLAMLRKTENISSLVVGTHECAYYSRLVITNDIKNKYTFHYTYVLDENEVVFGCEAGVRSALEEMINEGARKIVVIKTCVPELIGEDFENCISDLKEETPIMVLNLAHFKSNGYGLGYEAFFKGLAHWTIDSVNSTSIDTSMPISKGILNQQREMDNPLIYVLGAIFPKELITFFKRSLPKIIHINKPHKYSHLDLEARGILLITSPEWSAFASAINQAWGWPVISLFDVYDAHTLETQYRTILDYYEAEIVDDTALSKVFSEMCQLEAAYQKRIEGDKVTAYIGSSDIVTSSLAFALNQLGIEVKALHIEWLGEDQIKWQKRCQEIGLNPQVTFFTEDQGLYQKQTITICSESTLKVPRRAIMELEENQGFAKIEKMLELINCDKRRA